MAPTTSQIDKQAQRRRANLSLVIATSALRDAQAYGHGLAALITLNLASKLDTRAHANHPDQDTLLRHGYIVSAQLSGPTTVM